MSEYNRYQRDDVPDEYRPPDPYSPRPDKPEKEKKPQGWQLVAVQGISCAVIILVALVFRLIGGTAFDELRQSFNKSIMSNSFIATLTALFDSPSQGDGDTDPTGTNPAGGATDPAGTDATGTKGTEPAGSGNENAKETAPPAGGDDVSVAQRKVFTAPEGASFAKLSVARVAARPLESGTVTSYFGYREHPVSGKESFHLGLDIAAPQDTPIAALYFGVVSEVGESNAHGNYVKIYHGSGIEVMYAHCSKVLVTEATVVKQGEIVAQVGSTGVSTGNHLHIEVRKDGIAYDPTNIVPLSWYD